MCWHPEPTQRPTAKTLRQHFESCIASCSVPSSTATRSSSFSESKMAPHPVASPSSSSSSLPKPQLLSSPSSPQTRYPSPSLSPLPLTDQETQDDFIPLIQAMLISIASVKVFQMDNHSWKYTDQEGIAVLSYGDYAEDRFFLRVFDRQTRKVRLERSIDLGHYRQATSTFHYFEDHQMGLLFSGPQEATEFVVESREFLSTTAEGHYEYEKDYVSAVRNFRAAADLGDLEAQYRLGLCYERGHGVEKNQQEAVRFYTMAAQQGHADAQDQLALSKPTPPTNAPKSYIPPSVTPKSSTLPTTPPKSSPSPLILPKSSPSPLILPKSSPSPLIQPKSSPSPLIQPKSSPTPPIAPKSSPSPPPTTTLSTPGAVTPPHILVQQGEQHYHQKNYPEAVRLFRLAADQNNAQGQCWLGFCHDRGHGVSQNRTEAVRWTHLAAKQGLARAQNNMAFYYLEGCGVEKNVPEAIRLYRLSAEQGYALAQCNLARHYTHGLHVNQDFSEAFRLYRLAAEQGEIEAQYQLSLLYAGGRGVPQDSSLANQWFKRAADQGNTIAKNHLLSLSKLHYGSILIMAFPARCPLQQIRSCANTEYPMVYIEMETKSHCARCRCSKSQGKYAFWCSVCNHIFCSTCTRGF